MSEFLSGAGLPFNFAALFVGLNGKLFVGVVLPNTLFLQSISVQYKNLLSQIVCFKIDKPSSMRSQRLLSPC